MHSAPPRLRTIITGAVDNSDGMLIGSQGVAMGPESKDRTNVGALIVSAKPAFATSEKAGRRGIGLRLLVSLWIWSYLIVAPQPACADFTACRNDCITEYYQCFHGLADSQCIPELYTCAAACRPDPVPLPGPPPGSCPLVGDPVSPATGLFKYSHVDFVLRDIIPITLERTYREQDAGTSAFGPSMTHNYDIFVVVDDGGSYTYADLVLPDGGRVHYVRTSSGTGYEDAVFEHTSSPTKYFGSQITWVPAQGWLLSMKDGTRMTFGGASMLTSIQDRNGNAVIISRDSNNNVTAISSPSGRWLGFTYNTSEQVTQIQDNTGRTANYSYNGGRLSTFTDPSGAVTRYTYDAAGRLQAVTTPNGNAVVTNQYDANNRVTQQTHADGGVFTFGYTLNGTAVTSTSVTDPDGIQRQLSFNQNGYCTGDTIAVGRPEQQQIAHARDPNTNLQLSNTDALGRTTAYAYDTLGNVTSVTRLSGTQNAVTTAYTYDPTFNQLTSITDPLGHVWTLNHDTNGNLTAIIDPLGNQTTGSYNPEGQITSLTDGAGDTMHFGYADGELTSITDPMGQQTVMFDDAAGRMTWMQDPLGNQTNFSYSPLDDFTQIVDALGGLTKFAYDGDRNLTSVTDANANVTAYTYDPMDRRASRKDPLSAAETYAYDGSGNLTSHKDRNGNATNYTYDGLNRRTFAGFGYNGSAYQSTISYTWDGGDRLTQVVDSIAGTIARTYDGLDDLTDEQTANGEVSYGYDNARRRTAMTVVGQPAAASYAWDSANRLTGITQGSASVSFNYDSASRRTTLTLPNGIVVAYSYDNDSRVSAMIWTLAGNQIGDLEYDYDADGHVIEKTGSFAQTNLPQPVTGNSFNADNEMTAFNGTAMSYDANGNLLNDGSNTYAWDTRNHLSAITGANTASFVYDPLGRRMSKTIGATATSFLYDGLNPVQELQSGSPSANMLTGLGIDEYFQRTDASGASSYLTDALGSTLALANSAGGLATSYTYDPFGNTTIAGSSTNPFQFTGRENDGTGLYFYRHRYYHRGFQRFISQDPLGFIGGINLYSYVSNNPTNFTDRVGLQEEPPDDPEDPESPDNPDNPYSPNAPLQPTQPPQLSGPGLPPPGLMPPIPNPDQCKIGAPSRPSERAAGGLSLWDPNGGEWRYSPDDTWHNPHWDYNPWDQGPNTPWQNIPIGGLPPRK